VERSTVREVKAVEVEEVEVNTLRASAREEQKSSTNGRAPDVLWEALVEVLGCEPSTASERGRRNKALKELRAVKATPEEVRERSREYGRRWPAVTLSATALAVHWSELATGPPRPSMRILSLDELD
jgi:hypothetical protein